MAKKVTCLLSLGVSVLIVGCASTAARGPVADSSSLASAGYLKYWSVELPFQKGESVRDTFLLDENLYITSTLGNFYTVEATQGLLRWTRPLTRPEYAIYRPSHLKSATDQGPLCVVTTSRTYLIDRYSGDPIESFTPEFAPGTGAIGDDSRLYFGGADGKMHCISWRHPFGRAPLDRWELLSNGPVRATPSFQGPDKLVFASQGGFIASCYALDKALDWRAHTEDAIVADPWVDNAGVYVACTDRSLYKFDALSGALLWRKRFPKPLDSPPIVIGSTVFQYCETVGLSALDAASGQDRWVRADAIKFVAALAKDAVILTAGGGVELVDHESGSRIRDLGASGISRAVTNTRDDRVILLTADGRILCARPESTPYLRRQQVLAAKDRLRGAPAHHEAPPPPPALDQGESRDPFRSERDK